MSLKSKSIVIVIVLVLTLTGGLVVKGKILTTPQKMPDTSPLITMSSPTATPPAAPVITPSAAPLTTLPSHVQLTVPFVPQTPLEVWDGLHEEACEEASLVMVQLYHAKQPTPSKANMEAEIRKLIDYENRHGYDQDITISQLSALAKEYYHLDGSINASVSVEAIKAELAAGRPVIVPAAGRQLPNPHFKSPGPVYHMLVITGYDQNGFITNDPGTKFGEGFRYSFTDLLNAIHDWNPQDILQGQKVYFVVD